MTKPHGSKAPRRPLRVWRITDAKFAKTALSGAGGLSASGRWHERGVAIVYASETPELAVLETLVNVAPEVAPPSLVLLGIEIDHRVRIESLDAKTLPDGWRRVPGPSELRALGMEWLARARSAALRVPSAIVPLIDGGSRNILINPRHPDAARIRVTVRELFPLDPRLLR